MEGMRFPGLSGDVEMRATDHQLLQNSYIATWSAKDGKAVKYDFEKSGFGWKARSTVPAYVTTQPTSCQMKRPEKS